jgi:hypothetical protein
MSVILIVALLLATATAARTAGDFEFKEHLGRDWTHEFVSFHLNSEQAAKARAGIELLAGDGNPVRYQLVSEGGASAPSICFQTDLPKYSTPTFRFGNRRAAPASDLRVEEAADMVTISNLLTGLRLRRKLAPGQGPIAGVRLGSGLWTGESTFDGASSGMSKYEVVIKEKGPVIAVVECRAAFADGGEWRLVFRIYHDEPVILVDESFDAPGGGKLSVALGGAGFRPSHMFHRNADVSNVSVMSDPIASYHLEPWLRWNNPRHGTWFALHTPGTPPAAGKAPDMLMIGLLRPSIWVDPQWKGKAKQPGAFAAASVRGGLVGVDFALGGGQRAWMLGVLDATESVAILSQTNKRVAPPPQKLVIKHGDFPLNKVKDFVLEWDGDHDNHPRLYLKKRDLPALRTLVKSDPRELARWKGQQPIDKYLLDGPVREFIATSDPQLGKLMAAKAEEYLQSCVDWYLQQDDKLTPGAAPHMQTLILSVANLIDPVLGTEAFPPEARRRALARLAFLGYVVSSPDYWSPERGYTGFANMTSVVAMYRTSLGCLLPSHPRAKGWAELGLNQLSWQLDAWSDEDGGWIEAPHYAMVSFDHLLAGFAMGANAGFSDRLFDPRMRKVFEWFAAISTPRDARIGGWRHQPPIGNTYHGEPNGVYGIAAALWKERDPAFAARMQWLFEQHGSYPGFGSGWNFPAMLGYRFLMNSSGVAPQPAELGSRMFRNTGVVLRNSSVTDRETYLHMIGGSNHEHYDADSGSIILYGKGRVLCDDWGYLGLHPDKWHSMLTGPAANGYRIMTLRDFAPAAAFDYLAGTKGAWERQIGFSKDTDPLGPNFFLLRDTYAAEGEFTWRLWLTTGITAGVGKQLPATPDKIPSSPTSPAAASKDNVLDDLLPKSKPQPTSAAPGTVALTPFGATLSGMEDVDLDIFLFTPERLSLSLEPAKLQTSTGNWMGNIVPVDNSQIALTARGKGRGAVTSLLYPRLKTEPSPTVTWSADGRIAEVRTKWGTDHVFLSPVEDPPPVSDGKTLLPLRNASTQDGIKTTRMAGDDQLTVIVTPVNGRVSNKTHQIPPASVALHPGPKNPVTAVWQSPITGTVTIDARLRDGDVGGGDGILYELRHRSKLLAEGAMANGGPEVVIRTDKVNVSKGDLVRLVILPGQTNPEQSNWWDTTLVEFIISDESGHKWSFRDALVAGEPLGNQLTRDFDRATWWVCSGDAEKFDPASLAPPPIPTYSSPNGQITFQGRAASVRERNGKLTFTLGAAGKVKAGIHELAAESATTSATR